MLEWTTSETTLGVNDQAVRDFVYFCPVDEHRANRHLFSADPTFLLPFFPFKDQSENSYNHPFSMNTKVVTSNYKITVHIHRKNKR